MVLAATSLATAEKAAGKAPGEKPGTVSVEVTKLTAKVKAIDAQKRTVTLEGEGGGIVTVNAKHARNFDQIKVGDQVRLDYVEELAIFVREAEGPPDAQSVGTVALAAKGKKPGGLIAETTEIQANVEAIDYKKRTVTLKGPAGGVRTLKVGKEVKNFNEVKKGDQVVVRFTEALALELAAP
jgi:ribosomal 50S subunit-recycling heat shock protein